MKAAIGANIFLVIVAVAFIAITAVVRIENGVAPAYLVIPAILSVFGFVAGVNNIYIALKLNR